MKKSIIILAFLTLGSLALMAQAPPPPPAGATNGGTNGPIGGGGAPIDGGLAVSLAMVAGFGVWKLLRERNQILK